MVFGDHGPDRVHCPPSPVTIVDHTRPNARSNQRNRTRQRWFNNGDYNSSNGGSYDSNGKYYENGPSWIPLQQTPSPVQIFLVGFTEVGKAAPVYCRWKFWIVRPVRADSPWRSRGDDGWEGEDDDGDDGDDGIIDARVLWRERYPGEQPRGWYDHRGYRDEEEYDGERRPPPPPRRRQRQRRPPPQSSQSRPQRQRREPLTQESAGAN